MDLRYHIWAYGICYIYARFDAVVSAFASDDAAPNHYTSRRVHGGDIASHIFNLMKTTETHY